MIKINVIDLACVFQLPWGNVFIVAIGEYELYLESTVVVRTENW